MPSPDALVRRAAAAANSSPARLLATLLTGPCAAEARGVTRHTLLAVCPTSPAVVEAAIDAAEHARAPLLVVATLNQVDRDGGYTGWTPAALRSAVDDARASYEATVPVLLGLDHGGPYKKDAQHDAQPPLPDALAATEASIDACLAAGYEVLHLDATTDPHHDGPLPVEALVDRTVHLQQYAERARRAHKAPPIGYEVGPEEAHAKDAAARFEAFVTGWQNAQHRADVGPPVFVVGDLGTQLNTQAFDASRARRFATLAHERLGALLKAHYTDDVDDLPAYPLHGVGGANVGPGLAAVEYDALCELAALAERIGAPSEIPSVVRHAVVASERWTKWVDDPAPAFDALPASTQAWLVRTGSRYVWSTAAVQEARRALYDRVQPYRNGPAYVHWRLRTALLRYLHAFNLVGWCDALPTWLAAARS
ncbi:class II D-tagatose-bisphosphate aldolase non-catalytic subunit [Salisaeta longa]|uniref:class II D-tagatose-bisphosphate aldolase non-catalytic subunit n=1 Tax=Salisaeta longa TaxID=503170 RepID=UPI0003B5025D|nr:class II D-tagatose-bisphosphate aldolase, non-catalytic subunit [Salisaeta longa]